jgi:hypothetical protein
LQGFYHAGYALFSRAQTTKNQGAEAEGERDYEEPMSFFEYGFAWCLAVCAAKIARPVHDFMRLG